MCGRRCVSAGLARVATDVELAPSDPSSRLSSRLRPPPLAKPIALPPTLQGKLALDLDLATGYEWVDVRDEGDEGEPPAFPLLSLIPTPHGPSPRRRLTRSVTAVPLSLDGRDAPSAIDLHASVV